MDLRRASEFAPKDGSKAKTTTNAGKKSARPANNPARANAPGSIACPDCLGAPGNGTCARCDGSGVVCARCKGTGYLYRLNANGATSAVACPCGKATARRVASLWPFLERTSSLQGELLAKTFDNFHPRPGCPDVLSALKAARKFASQPKGWLVISGTPGVGKTHLAAAIANELIRRRQPALFLNVPELLSFLRAGFHANNRDSRDPDFETRLHTIKDFPILILDDWGAHSDTPWADEQLYLILNSRTERVLPTVVTSNLILEDIDPPRVRSRLMNRLIAEIVEMFAPDFRRED